MGKNLDLSISIVSFNTKDILRTCLSSIYSSDKAISFEVIVVDNGSSDGSAMMVEKEFPNVFLIKNKYNLFFTKAHNQALKLAKGKFILILNSDTIMRDRTLDKAIFFLKKHPKIGALGVKQVFLNGQVEKTCQRLTTPMDEFFHSNLLARLMPFSKRLESIHYASWNRKSSRFVEAVSDSCLFAPHAVIQKIGFYDARFLLFFTENDLCLRIKQTGYAIYHLANASITHVKNQSVQKLKPIDSYRIYEHDMLLYYKKYFGVLWLIILWVLYRPNLIYWHLKKSHSQTE